MREITIKTGSENTVNAYGFLKANRGVAFTTKQIADSLGVKPINITSGLTSLAKNGAVKKEDKDFGEGSIMVVYTLNEDVSVTFASNKAKKGLTKGTAAILQTLKDADAKEPGKQFLTAEIATALDKKANQLTGGLTSLVRKELLAKENVVVELADKTVEKVVYSVTDKGRAYED